MTSFEFAKKSAIFWMLVRYTNNNMKLLWNDEKIQIVEDSFIFDEFECTVVRKFYVKFTKKLCADVVNEVEKYFHQFGTIECIKCTNSDWTYVTYATENEAVTMWQDVHRLSVIQNILPADTWKQPQLQATIDDVQNYFEQIMLCDDFKVNNDVIYTKEYRSKLRSFEVLTNEQIATVREKFFATSKQFILTLGEDQKQYIRLRDVRIIVRIIGPIIQELKIDGGFTKWMTNAERYLSVTCKQIGINLKKIVIYFTYDDLWLKSMQPLLGRIERLDLFMSNYDFDGFDLDLQAYCPYLKTLKLCLNMKGEHLVRPWPSLERFTNRNNQYMEESLIRQMLQNNPQIKYLNLEAFDCDNLVRQIVEFTPNLHELCLMDCYPDISSENISSILELKNLTKLSLTRVREQRVDGLIECISKFVKLKTLKFEVYCDGELDDSFQPNQSFIVNWSRALVRIERLHIRYCRLSESTVLELVRYLKKLQLLEMRGCAVPVTIELLKKIQSFRTAKLELRAHEDDLKLDQEYPGNEKLDLVVLHKHAWD